MKIGMEHTYIMKNKFYLIILSTIFVTINLWGDDNPFQLNYEDIISMYESLDQLTPEKLSIQAPSILKITEDFLLANPNLSTNSKSRLMTVNNRLATWHTLKTQFDNCINFNITGQNLHERVLNVQFSRPFSSKISSSECFNDQYSPLAPGNISQLNKFLSDLNLHSFHNELIMEVITNSVEAFLEVKYKYDPEFMKRGKLAQKDIDHIIQTACISQRKIPFQQNTDICELIDPSFKKYLTSRIVYLGNELSNFKKTTATEALDDLNQSIDRLNTSLKKIILKKNEGIFYDNAELSDIKAKNNYETYIRQYLDELKNYNGLLLLTEAVRNRAGDIRQYHHDDTRRILDVYDFKPHQYVKIDQVTEGIRELETRINDSIKNIAIGRSYGIDTPEFLSLIKNNPLAVSKIVLNSPHYADVLCSAINTIHAQDKNKQDFYENFKKSHAIISTVFLTTGAGTVLASLILTGKMAIKVGTRYGNLMAISSLGIGSNELVNAIYSVNKAYNQHKEIDSKTVASMTYNADDESILENKQLIAEFKSARNSALISLAVVAWSFPAAGKFLGLLTRPDPNITSDKLQKMTNVLLYIADNQFIVRVKQIKNTFDEKEFDDHAKALTDAFFDNLLTFLLTTDNDIKREKILNAINSDSLPSKKLLVSIMNTQEE